MFWEHIEVVCVSVQALLMEELEKKKRSLLLCLTPVWVS